MVREHQHPNKEFAILLSIDMIAGACFPVAWGVRDAFRALIVSILEVEEIDIHETC